ncbi:hypothetical protein [Geopseudomonas aromaticivorans]
MIVRDHRKILQVAKDHHAFINQQLHAWSIEEHDGCTALVSYWYGLRKQIQAKVLYIDYAHALDMEIIVAWLNAQSGSGPALLGVLKSMHGLALKEAMAGTQQHIIAESKIIH